MPIEKQIQIDIEEGEKLTIEDFNSISIINNFLYQHEADNEEENEDTIMKSLDKDIIASWNALKHKFENRISFINSDPNPDDYLVFTEQNKIAEEERLIISTSKGAESQNKQNLKILLQDIEDGYALPKMDVLTAKTILESILDNFDQTKASQYNKQIEECVDFIDFFITNEKVQENASSYEKYDADQKRLLAQLNNPSYLERLKKEFNCSIETAQAHLNTRIANCCIGYSLDLSDKGMTAQFVPYKDDAKRATILPSKRENSGNRYTLFHEIGGHRVTNADGAIGESIGGLSDYAKRELLNSFDARNNGIIYGGDYCEILYFKETTERYARKKVLDFEMEDLGIKNYEDPFTENTFQILMEFYDKTIQAIQEGRYNELTAKEKGFLSKNSIQFIQTTKREFSTYEKIFNNIA